MTAPAEVEADSAPRTTRPASSAYDVVSVIEVDKVTESEGSSYLNSSYYDTDERLGMLTTSVMSGNRASRVRSISEGGSPQSLTISDWNIVQARNTPTVEVGDFVFIHAVREYSYFRNPNIYEYDQPYPVVTIPRSNELHVMATNAEGGDQLIAVMSWTKADEPQQSELLRPPVEVGMKVRILGAAPARYMTDGTLGTGVGIVTRTKRGERPRVVVTSSTDDVKKEITPNSWEIIPFDNTEDELACFKEATYWLAKGYGRDHSMCSQLDAALGELGLLPNRRFKVTFEASVGDYKGKLDLHSIISELNMRSASEWPKGTVVETTKPKKARIGAS